MSGKCPTCGTPLDEIPFVDCATHKAYDRAIPVPTQEELIEALEQDLLELVYGRTGDD